MSTYWNIECKRCGYTVFDDVYGWSNHMGDEFAEICASGMLTTRPAGGHVSGFGLWKVRVSSDFDHHRDIDLHEIHDSDCEHDFEPRNEYGDWATPDMWPKGHHKSRVCNAEPRGGCLGIGSVSAQAQP